MGYRIIYDQKEKSRKRRFVLTLFVFIGFLSMVSAFWPEGKAMLRTILIPGDPDVTLQAAEVFAQELGNGLPFADAVGNFCLTVQRYGYPD